MVTISAMAVLDDDRPPAPAPAGTASLDISALLAKAQPSVVTVQVEGTGSGTGVVISEDGLILTNAHVVGDARRALLTFSDGSVAMADLVDAQPGADIALLQVPGASDLVPAELGRSADARVGDDVVAIGNALGLGGPPSVTRGIVSAKDRAIEGPGISLRDAIQTDAAINGGNSGGPLLDAEGRVIGINTVVLSGAQNVGFAIPIDQVKPIIEELRAAREPVAPGAGFLGVETVRVDALSVDQRDRLGITALRGAVVQRTVPGSGAASAGLQPGDVIVGVDGRPITSSAELTDAMRGRDPGEVVVVQYERNGRRTSVDVSLRRRDESGD